MKPIKTLCTLAEAQAWGTTGRISRKYDGIFEVREIGGVTVAGQLMRPKSGGMFTAGDRVRMACHGEFWVALDIVSQEPLFTRMAAFLDICRTLNGTSETIAETVTDIAACMASGAEGVCWQSWDWPYGQILAHKARWEGIVRVSRPPGWTQSVEIEDAATGQPRGKLPLRGGKCDRVRVGSLLKVTAMCITDAGKLREPVLDSDSPESWLKQF